MRRVHMLRFYCVAGTIFPAGAVFDLPDTEALSLIQQGYATEVISPEITSASPGDPVPPVDPNPSPAGPNDGATEQPVVPAEPKPEKPKRSRK